MPKVKRVFFDAKGHDIARHVILLPRHKGEAQNCTAITVAATKEQAPMTRKLVALIGFAGPIWIHSAFLSR